MSHLAFQTMCVAGPKSPFLYNLCILANEKLYSIYELEVYTS